MSDSSTPHMFRTSLILMWMLMIFIIVATFFCYWLNTSPWAMYMQEPIGSIEAGFYWSIDFLSTYGLIPIIWTIMLLIDHKMHSSAGLETAQQAEMNLDQKLIKPFYKNKFRMITTLIIVFVSLPWILALAGVFIGDIPGLNFFMSKQTIPWEANLPAVHLGMHHGFAGFFLCASVILVSYNINWIRNKNLKKFWGIIFNIVLFLGIYFVLQDFMNEQFYNFFRLNGIDFPFLNLIPFELNDSRMYIVLGIIVVLGILSYFYIWRKRIEIYP